MLTAHLPAGYLLTRTATHARGWQRETQLYRRLLAIGLAASILPDVDLLYYYFIDKQHHLHHGYLIHMPIFWVVVSAVMLIATYAARSTALQAGATIFIVNIFSHLALDSITEKIAWLYPLTNKRYGLFTVPARYDWWVWSFILHWTFLLELLIMFTAVSFFLLDRLKKRMRVIDVEPFSEADSTRSSQEI